MNTNSAVSKLGPLICTILFLISCSTETVRVPENPLFTRLTAEHTGVAFSNEVTPDNEFNIFSYRNFYNGGGVALGDINNDGRVDLYFTANQGSNRLYLNEGEFQFKDITDSAGVAGSRPWTTGATMADVNGDGLLDIYVLNSADISGNNRRNELFINRGDLTFTDEAASYNLDDNAFSVHASFFDYDADGDLDCFLLNNSFKGTGANMRKLLNTSRDRYDAMGGDKLFRNDDGVFTDVSREAGLHQGENGFGLGVTVGDVTGDHRPDIYVSNDFWERDYLYIHNGDGTFSEELTERTSHVSQASMGSDIGDINNDGRLDLFVTDMLPADAGRIKTMTVFDDYHIEDRRYHDSYHFQYVQNTLQVNNGNGTFRETGFMSGVAASDWSWGALMFDFSNDGWTDLFVSNGIYRDLTDMDFQNFISDRNNIARIVREKGEFNILDLLDRMPTEKLTNVAFVNNRDLTFSDRSTGLGFYEPTFSNGAAYADLDNDGDRDLVINNLNGRAYLYRNNAERLTANHFLSVAFEGEGRNPFGIGAHVTLYYPGGRQVAENMTSRSFQSSVPPGVQFGLGAETHVDSLIVVWPDRRRQVVRNMRSDRKITLRQAEADQVFVPDSEQPDPVIADATGSSITGDIRHDEDNYIDFNQDRLLPHMLSTRGPDLALGDVNGDGLTDFFVTGGLNDQDKVFIQEPDGRFAPLVSPDFIQDNSYESTAAALFDVDGDGDLDLMVGNGGNQFDLSSSHNRIRVYRNNGHGRFTRAQQLAPAIRMDACCIRPDDFDGDGDTDVFLGARLTPKKYGVDPQSYLLENDGSGKWTDVTPEALKRSGMITDAAWADRDGDGDNDLTVVGEWMPVTFFTNNGGSLEFDSTVPESRGWWSAIKETDLDRDGDVDFVLGNWGLNSKFTASPDHPFTMYVNDFNGDANSEYLITTFQPGDDTAYPFPTYDDLIAEMPFLRERLPDHHSYAEKTYEEIFTSEEREGARKKVVQTVHSSLLINNDGTFELRPLPLEAQISPVFGIVVEDFNRDNTNDLLLLGNLHGLKPEVGRLDDNYGVLLDNEGNLDFSFRPYHDTGIFIRGEVRDVAVVAVGEGRRIIIGRNDDDLMIYN